MKGPLAAMVRAAGRLDRASLGGRLLVCGSVGEEQTEGTALEPVIEAFNPDLVLIGEPTDLKLARGGRGRAEFVLEVSGKPAHASTPHLGKNAVLEAARLISEIEKVPLPRHALVGSGTLCLTAMISDPCPAQSVLPSKCRITYERRLVPGDTLEQVKAEFKGCCRRAEVEARVDLVEAKVRTPTGRLLHSWKWYAPWECPVEAPIVRAAVAALESVGLENGVSAYQFCTNAAFTAGIRTLPTIGFGPSRESLAHVVDEHIEIDALIAGRLGYEAIARRLLDRDDPL